MKKRNIILSLLTLVTTLSVGVGLLANKVSTSESIKAEDETRYVFIDVKEINKNGTILNYLHAEFFYEGGGAFSPEPGLAMDQTVSRDVWKIAIPDGCYKVFFNALYTQDDPTWIRAELRGSAITIPTNDKTMYKVTDYYSSGTIHEPGTFEGSWVTKPDIPDEAGYYAVTSENDYKYEYGVKMGEGEYGDKAQTLQMDAKKGSYVKVRSFFNYEEKSYPASGDGTKVNTDNGVNVYIDKDDKLFVEDYVVPPTEDGYFVFGTFDGTTISEYKDAYAAFPFVDERYDYIAVCENLKLKDGDVIGVRSYDSTRHSREIYLAPNQYYDTWYFNKDGNNLIYDCEFDRTYDIYIVKTDDSITFIPKDHSEKFYNKVTAVFFDRLDNKQGTQELPDQLYYTSGAFYPEYPSIDGVYCTSKAYYDEDCTQEYSAKFLGEAIHIYIKYYLVGYYMLPEDGDLTPMETTNIEEDSLAEINVNPTTKVTAFAYICFNEEGKKVCYQLNQHYDYAHNYWMVIGNVEYDGIEFYDFGYENHYRVYIKNDGNLYLKEGGSLFAAQFIDKIDDICDSTGMNTDLNALQVEWFKQKDLYEEVECKVIITSTEFKIYENPENIYEEMMSKYYFIINKYGSFAFENFIFTNASPIFAQTSLIDSSNNMNNLVVLIVAVNSVILISTLTFVFVKKRKSETK